MIQVSGSTKRRFPMKKAIMAIALIAFSALSGGNAAVTTVGATPLIAVELFARNEKVIPLSFALGDYLCIHVKPPEILVRNISREAVALQQVSIAGKSNGREVARFTIYENQIAELMTAQSKQINAYMSALDNAEKSSRLRRIHGEPVVLEARYYEGHILPPSAYALLGLADALLFFYEGSSIVDSLEIVVVAKGAGGSTSSAVLALPYTPYVCRGEYHFPIGGSCVVGNVPFGPGHRFGNSQEFAIDILDIQRNDDGSFSTSRVPSPMVIMGSDKASDYYIYGRAVKAMAAGTVLEVSDRYPDEFGSNPQEPFEKRKERLKQYLVEKGMNAESVPSGNYILIDHGNGEYARYCHLRQEILVKVGDQVKQGDKIGYVGNSGQSMEPHLHLELLDSPDINRANGLPIVFCNLNLARALESPSFGDKNSLVFSEFIFVFSD
jgi:hypothetical protein